MNPMKYFLNTDYEEMEVLGITGLFTNLRVESESLPEGFYKYSLREGDEEYFSTVENNVLVNHAGDFICKQKLPLGDTECVDLSEDDFGFTGEQIDLDKFFGVDIKTKVAEALDRFMFEYDPYEYADNLSPGQTDLVDDIRKMLDDREQANGIEAELKEICEEDRFTEYQDVCLAHDLFSKVKNIVGSFPEKREELNDQIKAAENQKGKTQGDEEQREPVVSEP